MCFVLFGKCYNHFMRITHLEQSGFIIETANGFVLAIDIGAFTPLENVAKLRSSMKIDAMLVSHIHGDHFSVPHIKALAPTTLYLNEECIEAIGDEELISAVVKVRVGKIVSVAGCPDMTVQFFDVDHGPNTKLRPRENFGFLIHVDGKSIYFAGDMFYPSGIEVTSLEVDYALLPVGTFYTFGPEQAVAFASTFKKIGEVIPMHYEKDPATKDQFINLFKHK